uniref:Protein Wnt n=1 Tax=Megaselia scalaris TaxID=36166 RepID=T1GQD3_MEGSC
MKLVIYLQSPDAIVALGAGHMMGAKECQHQFKGHRWNCSQVWHKNVFGHVMFVVLRSVMKLAPIALKRSTKMTANSLFLFVF